MKCEILSVGTELLLGDILNTDAQFLARELAAMGFTMQHQGTVGDNPERLREAVEHALSRSDIIITSGGLGPTADDITKEICAEVMGIPLVLHEESLQRMLDFFSHRKSGMPETNRKQAYLPEGGVVFRNDHGTAPGCAMERDGKCIICLPGPPRELYPMFNNFVKPYLSEKSGMVIISHNVRTFGIGESLMAETAGELLDMQNPTVAPYAKDGEALLRVTARAENEEKAEELIKPVIEEIEKRLGKFIYGIDVSSIQEKVVELLKEKKMKIGLAESCTAGYIAKRITEIPGSSEVFDCGIVSYANHIKEQILGVPHDAIEKNGVVSREVACHMAKGALKVSGADIALSVTGIAGPDPSESGKPAGLSYIALADKNHVWCIRFETGRSGDNREYNRYVTASNALNLARLYLIGKLTPEEAEHDFD